LVEISSLIHCRLQERKKAVKAENRERRKTKMPKAEKKKRVKATSRS
jgi:RIO kinase 1